jgi:hypothetical protein
MAIFMIDLPLFALFLGLFFFLDVEDFDRGFLANLSDPAWPAVLSAGQTGKIFGFQFFGFRPRKFK